MRSFAEAFLHVHTHLMPYPAGYVTCYVIGISLGVYPYFLAPHIGEPHQILDLLRLNCVRFILV